MPGLVPRAAEARQLCNGVHFVWHITYCWWKNILHHLGCILVVNNGKNLPFPQLVSLPDFWSISRKKITNNGISSLILKVSSWPRSSWEIPSWEMIQQPSKFAAWKTCRSPVSQELFSVLRRRLSSADNFRVFLVKTSPQLFRDFGVREFSDDYPS